MFKNRGGVAQWVARLTRDRRKGPRCFLEQETVPSLLSTGWLEERIRASFTQAKKNACFTIELK